MQSFCFNLGDCKSCIVILRNDLRPSKQEQKGKLDWRIYYFLAPHYIKPRLKYYLGIGAIPGGVISTLALSPIANSRLPVADIRNNS